MKYCPTFGARIAKPPENHAIKACRQPRKLPHPAHQSDGKSTFRNAISVENTESTAHLPLSNRERIGACACPFAVSGVQQENPGALSLNAPLGENTIPNGGPLKNTKRMKIWKGKGCSIN